MIKKEKKDLNYYIELRKELFPDAKSYTQLSRSEILENIKGRLYALILFPDYNLLKEDFENLSKEDLAKICYLAAEANDKLIEILQIASLN